MHRQVVEEIEHASLDRRLAAQQRRLQAVGQCGSVAVGGRRLEQASQRLASGAMSACAGCRLANRLVPAGSSAQPAAAAPAVQDHEVAHAQPAGLQPHLKQQQGEGEGSLGPRLHVPAPAGGRGMEGVSYAAAVGHARPPGPGQQAGRFPAGGAQDASSQWQEEPTQPATARASTAKMHYLR